MTLEPPLLVFRKAKAFWVEDKPLDEWTATLQAFRAGCFVDACCYDETGGLWPIVGAELKGRPSLLDRLFPWRRVAVRLSLGSRSEPDVRDVVSRLVDVLESGSEFIDSLRVPAAEVARRLESVRTPQDLLRVARECTLKANT